MIYCFGDSLTEGKPGISFVKYLSKKHKCKNVGLGGDTVAGLISRLEEKWIDKVTDSDYAVVGIGTNDILIPFFENLSPDWASVAKGLYRRGSVPCKKIDEFNYKYIKLIDMLKTKTQNIIVFGLPTMETTENDLDIKCNEHNKVIESICQDKNVVFIDFRKWQKQIKSDNNNNGSYFFVSKEKKKYGTVKDIVMTTYMPFEEKVSKQRGLFVTVDGCHFNSRSAKGLAEMIEEHIV
jgi:lysophospholipase L1-like esterase